MRVFTSSWVTFALLCASIGSQANPGDLDPTFGTNGVARFDFSQPIPIRVTGSALRSDGKIVVVGETNGADGLDHVTIGRLNADGTLDATFGTSGWTTFDAPNGASCATVGIGATGSGATAVARCAGLTTLFRTSDNGSVDTSIGPGGIRVDAASSALNPHAVVADNAGHVYVAGGLPGADGSDTFLKRYAADGSADASFGTSGLAWRSFGPADDEAMAVAIDASGRILVAGYARQVTDGPRAMLVARFSDQGTLAPFAYFQFVTMQIDEDSVAYSVANTLGGTILIGGRAVRTVNGQSLGHFQLLRLIDEGFPDNFGTFGQVAIEMPGADSTATSLLWSIDGTIVVGGTSVSDGASHIAFACLNWSGTLLSTCGLGGRFPSLPAQDNDVLRGAYLTSGSQYLAVGGRGSANRRLVVGRYAGTGMLDTGFGSGGAAAYSQIQKALGQVNDVAAQADGKILVAAIGPTGGSRIARLDGAGNLDTTFAAGGILDLTHAGMEPRGAYALAVQPDGRILVAGKARGPSEAPLNRTSIVRLLSDGTKDATWNGAGELFTEIDAEPAAIAVRADGKVFLLNTTAFGGNGHMELLRFTSGGVMDVDAPGIPAAVQFTVPAGYQEVAQALTFSGDDVVVAGYSTPPGGYPSMVAYRVLPTFPQTTRFDFGMPSVANAVVAQPDGKVILAGACGASVSDACFARIDVNGYGDWLFGANGMAVRSLASGSDRALSAHLTAQGKLLAGVDHDGGFGVALVTASGTLDTSFHGAGSNLAATRGAGSAGARQADGKVIVAGTDVADGNSIWVLARFAGDDETPPETTLSMTPDTSPTMRVDAMMTFTSSKPGSTFECSREGTSFVPCISPQMLYPLSDGTHTFAVRAIDAGGTPDPTPATRTWVVDQTPPTVTITSSPTGATNNRLMTVTFTASEPGATFTCQLTFFGGQPCTSPWTFMLGPDGPYALDIFARDVAGNMSQTPAHREWTLDTMPPMANFISGPRQPATNLTTATFALGASESAVTFQCRLDFGALVACAANPVFTGLAIGPHNLSIRATDAAGNIGPETPQYMWFIDLVVPDTSIGSGPSGTTGATNASFTFTATKSNATFECRLDGAAFAPCTVPATYTNLVPGNHTFDVRALDAAGNVDPTPASRTWQIAGIPDTIITSGPPAPQPPPAPPLTIATYEFTSPTNGATFECRLDSAAYAPCTSPISYSTPGTTPGTHQFSVRARWLGNVDPTPATAIFAIVPSPDTTITNGPPNPSPSTVGAFTFTSNASPATFECKLDGESYASCASPFIRSGLARTTHTFSVRARNSAGVVDPTPATYTWTIN